MHPLAYIALVTVMMMGMSVKQLGEAVRTLESNVQSNTASAMAVVANSAGQYARSNPAAAGPIGAATVGVPDWLSVPPGVGISLRSGKAYVFKTESSRGRAIGIALACRKGVLCATTVGGSMLDVRDQTVLGAVPAGVPSDNAVIVIY